MPFPVRKPKMKMDDTGPAQSLAVALNVSHKKKKMAQGGEVKDSAKMESRPMPSEVAKDSKMVHQNDHKGPQGIDFATESRPMPPKGKNSPLKHPHIMKGGTFTTKLRDDEDHLQDLAKTGSPGAQPKEEYNEEGPNRKGPSVPALKMKMMAEGGMINKAVSMKDAEEDNEQHPAGLESDNDQMKPSDDEIMSDKMGGMYAEGGEVDDMMQPHEEEAIEHAASIAAAIMAKKKMMAEGGQVDLNENSMEQPNAYYPRNEDEVLKENYDDDMKDMHQPEDSNEHGDEIESDKHDMISMIRRRMKMSGAMTK